MWSIVSLRSHRRPIGEKCGCSTNVFKKSFWQCKHRHGYGINKLALQIIAYLDYVLIPIIGDCHSHIWGSPRRRILLDFAQYRWRRNQGSSILWIPSALKMTNKSYNTSMTYIFGHLTFKRSGLIWVSTDWRTARGTGDVSGVWCQSSRGCRWWQGQIGSIWIQRTLDRHGSPSNILPVSLKTDPSVKVLIQWSNQCHCYLFRFGRSTACPLDWLHRVWIGLVGQSVHDDMVWNDSKRMDLLHENVGRDHMEVDVIQKSI